MFFYTVAINYSNYSLNSEVIGDWVKWLFHKNDGYRSPVVLNPMRTKGEFSIEKENRFAKYRLLSNLLSTCKDKAPDEKIYLTKFQSVKNIRFTLNEKKIKEYTIDDTGQKLTGNEIEIEIVERLYASYFLGNSEGKAREANIYTIQSVNKETHFVYLVTRDGYVKKPQELKSFEAQWTSKDFTLFEEDTKGVPKMAQKKISFNSGGYDFGEFFRQLALQERSINAMSPLDWLQHKTAFDLPADQGGGRHKKADYAQSRSRKDESRMKYQIEKIRLENENKLTPKQIEKEATRLTELYMDQTAALHGPDQIGGGHFKGITGVGDLDVNSSIGSQWKARHADLKSHVENFIDTRLKGKPEEIQKKAKMNVDLQLKKT